jgi:hypothetical protein
MSLRDLERAGLLLPQEEWGHHDLHSKVNRPLLLSAWAVAAISAVLTYLGNGLSLTWFGITGMLLSLILFTHVSIVAINKRNREEEQLWEQKTLEDDLHESGGGAD